ncbi:MAG: hypothetical protein IJ754_08065 [Bacteroidaceae bacterium]|nr:hypothetical protein [Bacteroidaceae bacterium]MBQ9190031.1 hypothetical protein [Bacteroidaceae bacterium]MBR1791690.1 hypothetical protein [Bacteroidaceae bacterium]
MLYNISSPEPAPPTPAELPTAGKVCASDFADRSEMVATMLLAPNGLGQIQTGLEKHFYSKGAFNLVQLVLYLLRQTGPAHVFLSSYSIAEDSLAALKRREEKGELLSIRFLIDNRVRSISPKPFAYLAEAFHGKYRCCALHAKVALLWNSEWHVAVVTSMNATHNPKLERGIIYTSKEVFDFDLKTLEDEFDQGTT